PDAADEQIPNPDALNPIVTGEDAHIVTPGDVQQQFANVYRAWYHETYGDASFNAVDAAEIPEAGFGHHEDVVVRVSTQHEIRRVLATIKDPRVKQAFVLSSAGHSHVEIARRLGVTDKAVERMMANERDRQRRENVA
ncbi:hypothetical protein D6T64_00135, partial [Cryobacterium melibiosiphilum]